ncbi:MAG: thiamine phosphate synthase [Candidatus Micrarchaeia archaeon]
MAGVPIISGFYFITDRKLTKNGIYQDAQDAIRGGARIIQLRDKQAGKKELLESALKLKQITGKSGALLIVNDSIELALESCADGAHIGQQDELPRDARQRLKGKILGISVSTRQEAKEAEAKGADYLGVGPIFATSTKLDAAKPIGIEGLREIRKSTSLPIIAIGGISMENARSVIDAGADGICAMSAAAGDGVENKARRFSGLFNK